MDEYSKPKEHIQKGIIANTPMWLREHFRNEAYTREKLEQIARDLYKENPKFMKGLGEL